MQYKTITALFALFVSTTMAMPAAAPVDAGAIEARNYDWKQDYPSVKEWRSYKDDDGELCQPFTEKYSFSYAYSVSAYVSYSYSNNHLQAPHWDWKQQYPSVKQWKAYPKDDGAWCYPEDDDYSFSYAFSASFYVSYSSSGNW